MGEIANINSTGLVFFLMMSVLLIIVPRRLALLPIIATCCYITLGQQIVIATLNFTMMRLIILVGWIRIMIRKEYRLDGFHAIDKIIIWWVISAIVTYTLLYQTSEAFVNRLGFAYNALGMYFLFRFLVRDLEEAKLVIKMIALAIIPLALFMFLEKATGRNSFSIFGGVPEITEVRLGKLRTQGPFAHPILAGTFGATIMPLCYGLWKERKGGRALALLGLVSSTMITVFSASSGPAMAYAAGIFGWMLWHFRRHMKTLLWGTLVTMVALDVFVMKTHVWFLIDRLSDLLGARGHGWYRAKVIDEAFNHIGEWWLIGVKYTAHWDLTVLPAYPDRADITNQYIQQGVNGGLITMVLFIMVIFYCYRAIGRALKAAEGASEKIILWALGVSLLTHAASFVSVSYFDQMVVFWYLLLAMIHAATRYSTVAVSETDTSRAAKSVAEKPHGRMALPQLMK